MQHRHIYFGIPFLLLCLQSSATAEVCDQKWTRTTPNSRYTVLSDSSQIEDRATELVWQRCSVGQNWTGTTCEGAAKRYTWAAAMEFSSYARGKSYAWRLPRIDELSEISDLGCKYPSINESIFPSTMHDIYWSSTSQWNGKDQQSDSADVLDFTTGYGNYADPYYKKKVSSQYVRLVRSPCPFEWIFGLVACRWQRLD